MYDLMMQFLFLVILCHVNNLWQNCITIFILLVSVVLFIPDNTPLRSSLVAEANVVELFRDEPEEELGLRIVGGKDTPLGNIVIQEIVRDSAAARDGRLAPGDHILEVKEWKRLGLHFLQCQVSSSLCGFRMEA